MSLKQNIKWQYPVLPSLSSRESSSLSNSQICTTVTARTHTGKLLRTDRLRGSPHRLILLMTHLLDIVTPPLCPGATLSLADELRRCRADFSALPLLILLNNYLEEALRLPPECKVKTIIREAFTQGVTSLNALVILENGCYSFSFKHLVSDLCKMLSAFFSSFFCDKRSTQWVIRKIWLHVKS